MDFRPQIETRPHLDDVLDRIRRAWSPYAATLEHHEAGGMVGTATLVMWRTPEIVSLAVTVEPRNPRRGARLELRRGSDLQEIEENPVVVTAESPSLLPVDLDVAIQGIIGAALAWKEGTPE